jgi:hypothetical protein
MARCAFTRPTATDPEVGRLVAAVRTRVLRLLRRCGAFSEADDGNVPAPRWMTSSGARQAHLDGFDLPANVAANNRDGLEQLARYVLRPPIAQERLTLPAKGPPPPGRRVVGS